MTSMHQKHPAPRVMVSIFLSVVGLAVSPAGFPAAGLSGAGLASFFGSSPQATGARKAVIRRRRSFFMAVIALDAAAGGIFPAFSPAGKGAKKALSDRLPGGLTALEMPLVSAPAKPQFHLQIPS